MKDGCSERSFVPFRRNWAVVLAIATGGIAFWVAAFYSGQPLLEAHAFRQTQTALTSYWMIQEGWRLSYQTPVLGYPWAIPFEFPIFQSLAALVAWAGDFPLDPVGRLLSFFFLLACAWPAVQIARRLDLPPEAAWAFCALLWSSPIYLFWGRTFMIETAATFFMFAAIPYALDIRHASPSWRSAVLFALFATLAILQKVTTAAPVIMGVAFLMLAGHLQLSGIKMPSLRHLAWAATAFCAPVIAVILWTHYADVIKEQNPFGVELTSQAIAQWNFGTLNQRLDVRTLKIVFWDRIFVSNAGGVFGVFLVAGALLWGNHLTRRIVFAGLLFFVLPVLVFMNLHIVHDYYQVACVLFLIGALAVASVLWLPRFTGHHAVAPMVISLLVGSNYVYFFSDQYPNKIRTPFAVSRTTASSTGIPTLAISDVIRRFTPYDSGIVVFGADWSSEIAYYSQRKSFTVPISFKAQEAVWSAPARYLGDKRLGAIVFCVTPRSKLTLEAILRQPDVMRTPNLTKVENCYVWTPKGDMQGTDPNR